MVNDLLVNLHSVDKLEQMLGSYGPSPTGEPYTKNFDPEESPSGVVARSGTYHVRSRVVDDDGEVYAGMSAGSGRHARVLTRSMDRLGMVLQTCQRVVNDSRRCFFPLVPASFTGILLHTINRIVLHVLSLSLYV